MHTMANDVAAILGPNGAKGTYPVFMAAAPLTIEQMRARQLELQTEAQALLQQADTEGRAPTEDENTRIEQLATEAESIGRTISARERVEQMAQPQPRLAVEQTGNPAPGGGPRRATVEPRPSQSRTGGFAHLGEFAQCVFAAQGKDDAGARQRLSQMNEGVGEEGGFAVPPEFKDGIVRTIEGEDSLMPLCDNSTTSRNSLSQTVDETSPWGTVGIRGYWEPEARAATATNAKLTEQTTKLNKYFVRVDATDELLEDAPQLNNYLQVRAPERIVSDVNLSIVQGNGVGKPLGIMKSGALVTVAAATSQSADTIHHRNIVAMMGRIYARSWPRSRWLMHADVWAKLPLMSFRDAGDTASTVAASPYPVYMPPSGIAGVPYGTLMGRPIMVLEAMETIGDLGDILLADLSQYRILTKSGGLRMESSIHLKFDTDETVFRFILRIGGNPMWTAPVSPRDGSNTRSPFVTLASR